MKRNDILVREVFKRSFHISDDKLEQRKHNLVEEIVRRGLTIRDDADAHTLAVVVEASVQSLLWATRCLREDETEWRSWAQLAVDYLEQEGLVEEYHE